MPADIYFLVAMSDTEPSEALEGDAKLFPDKHSRGGDIPRFIIVTKHPEVQAMKTPLFHFP